MRPLGGRSNSHDYRAIGSIIVYQVTIFRLSHIQIVVLIHVGVRDVLFAWFLIFALVAIIAKIKKRPAPSSTFIPAALLSLQQFYPSSTFVPAAVLSVIRSKFPVLIYLD